MQPSPRVQNLPKAPPHSIDAEVEVLGAILTSPQAWEVVGPLVRADDFFRSDHQLIYRTAETFLSVGKQCDFVVVTDALRSAGRLQEAGSSYIGTLASEAGSNNPNLEAHARIIAEHARRRKVIALCAQVGDAAYGRSPSAQLLELLNVGLEQVGRHDTGKAKSFAEVLDAADRAVKDAKERRAAGKLLGAPTGIPCLDQRIGGLCRGKLVIVAARPGLGKSALLNQIAVHAARMGHPGFVASLEMADEEIGIRAMASAANVNVTRLTFGAKDEHERACAAAVPMMQLPLWVDTDTYDLAGICAQIAHAKRVHGITWAAVDHIGLLEADGYHSRNDQLSAITRTLKKLAKRLDICVVALSQLNRTVEKERRQPVLSDLRDSGGIEQDANVALFLHSNSKDSDDVTVMQFGLLKNRGGRKGWIKKRIDFDGATQRFTESDEPLPEAELPLVPRTHDRKRAAAGDS